MQACLLTGGTGFVGRHIDKTLASDGFRVVRLVREAVGQDSIVGDLRDPNLQLPSLKIQIVVHAAGLAHYTPRTSAERYSFFETNRDGVRNLLAAMEARGILPEAFVFVSTVAVYGATEGTLITEDRPRVATDPYGASKREAEDLLYTWSTKNGVRLGIIRLPLVVGKGAPGNWKRMVRGIATGRYLGIADGTARRSMVCADDVARIVPKLAATGGVFHLTDGYHPSFTQLERGISAALLKACPKRLPMYVARLGALAGDWVERTGMPVPFNSTALIKLTSTLTFSDEKARRQLNWSPSAVLDRLGELI